MPIINKRFSSNIQSGENSEDAISRITKLVSEKFRDEIAREGFSESVKVRIRQTIANEASALNLSLEEQKRVEHKATVNIIGLGPLEAHMQDSDVTEIIVQQWNNICVEKAGVIEGVDTKFNDEEQLITIINRIVNTVGRKINISTPMVDARLPDGSRINATIRPATPDGATLTIRKFSNKARTGADYVSLRSLNVNMLRFLAKSVEAKISILISGGTDTGKTTLLNMLSSFIPENELIITIEDSCELQLNQHNVRRMEARQTESNEMMPITIQSLVKNALRMRPDRIIVGEIRDGTVVDMLTAMSTGHEGSMSTVHANNPANLMNSRLPILYSMNNSVSFTDESRNLQIADAIQLVVHISKLKDGSRKITHITHVYGTDEKGRVKLNDIFKYDEEKCDFIATGYVPKEIIRQAKTKGITIPLNLFKQEGEEQ